MSDTRDDFYIGYLPETSPGLARWLRTRARLLLLLMVAVPLALVFTMGAFSDGVFEFGNVRSFRGILRADPYPVLLVQTEGEEESRWLSHLLVSEGKFGAESGLSDLDGQGVELAGTLIERGGQPMIEVAAGSVRTVEGEVGPTREDDELGIHVLEGEIVDSKCFLGVMKPGNLKPHRACATRCISGGIPPVFLVREENERATYLLLVDEQGRTVNERILDRIAEPLQIEGRVRRLGDLLLLYADPATYRRL